MDFNKLMQTMRELDRPVGEAKVQECGMDTPMMSPVPPLGGMTQPPPAHPSMSLNLNAQGMDNIESLLKLMTKVNPDMINQKAPLNAMPHAAEIDSDDGASMLTPPGPSISGIGDLGNLDSGPLKMLPDLDGDNDEKPGGELDIDIGMGDKGPGDTDDEGPNTDDGDDGVSAAQGDLDNDGDHDMDDHEAEEDNEEDQEDPQAEAVFCGVIWVEWNRVLLTLYADARRV